VLAINTRTGMVTANIEVGRFPGGVAVNPVTGTVYVANTIGDTISVIDGKTNTVTTTIPVTGTPDLLTVNAGTDTVYSPEFNGDTITLIDGQTNLVTGTIHVTGLVAAAAIARTNTVFVTRQHEISVIDGATNVKAQTVRVGRLPFGLAPNTSTGRLYVANQNGGNVSVLSPVKGSSKA
jgi:YVTN family beta-propeller protein